MSPLLKQRKPWLIILAAGLGVGAFLLQQKWQQPEQPQVELKVSLEDRQAALVRATRAAGGDVRIHEIQQELKAAKDPVENYSLSSCDSVRWPVGACLLWLTCGVSSPVATNEEWLGSRAPDGTLENNYSPPQKITIEGQKALINIRYKNASAPLLRIAFLTGKNSDIVIDTDIFSSNWGLYFHDFDQDGNKDILICDFGSAPNVGARYYFYDSKKKSFEQRPDFEEHAPPTYHPRNHLFSGYGRSGTERYFSIYKIHSGRLQKLCSGSDRPTGLSFDTYQAVGSRMVLRKRISIGSATNFRDILPHANPEWHYRVTTIYNPNGSIARRFYRGDHQRDLWEFPEFKAYAKLLKGPSVPDRD